MMECPCTDRYLKVFSEASTLQTGHCQDAKTKADTTMQAPEKCFEGAVSLGMTPAKSNLTVNDMSKPKGCYATAVAGGYEIAFNSAASNVSCGAKNGTHPRSVSQIVNDDVVNFETDVDMCAGATAAPPFVFCLLLCVSCLNRRCHRRANDLVTITATGPAAGWFAVGFGSQTMDGVCVGACPPTPGTNAIIFMTDGTAMEHELGMHADGHAIPTSVKVTDHKVVGGKRTVTVTRSLKVTIAADFSAKDQSTLRQARPAASLARFFCFRA